MKVQKKKDVTKMKVKVSSTKPKPSKTVEKAKVKKIKSGKLVKPNKSKELKRALKNTAATIAKVKNAEKPPSTKLQKSKKKNNLDIEGLKELDPEFYDFLKKNDKKLLEFNVFDSDEESDEEDIADNQPTKKKKTQKSEKNSDDDDNEDDDNDAEEDEAEKFHQPNADLEVASDESDFEDGEESTIAADGTQKITLNLLRQWQVQLEQPNVSVDVLRKVVQAFSSALTSISGDENEARAAPSSFKVVGPAAFNGVIQLCVLHLQPAIMRFMGLTSKSTIQLHKTKKWVKVRGCLRYYLTDLIRLIEQVSSAHILSVLLKHLHQMAGMVGSFSTLSKTILKRLIVLWSTGDETVRVLAFLCILKITRSQQVSMFNHVLKAMYLSYVRNSKFVSPNTLPGINFMRRSLVEMFALDLNSAYHHVFLYIRQLAIHLRNAVILKKKDSFQAVYNWQFINSLRLWVDLLGTTANKPQLQPLVYPLVTIAVGVIRLIPTAQYFPLRFHCLQALISLCKQTNTFVPILPLTLEVLRSKTFNRKHTAVSMKPLQFTCILRLNKGQLAENGFRDEVIEQVCGLTLEYLAHESAALAFCDLVVPSIVALKAYLKECRNANHSRKVKQLLDKIQENSRFIEKERGKITFGLKDGAQVQAWEAQTRNKGTPLTIYYNSWVKTHETKKRRQAAQTDNINSDYDLPSIKRKNASGGAVKIRNDDGDMELFPSDSEGENDAAILPEDDEEEPQEKPKKQKIKKNKKSQQIPKAAATLPEDDLDDGDVDIVKDLDMDDW